MQHLKLLRRRFHPKTLPYSLTQSLSSHSLSFDHDPPFSLLKKPPKQPIQNPQNTPHTPIKSDLPFDFRYSYSESDPSVKPISFREPPKYSPFGPGRLDRKWTGTCAPVGDDEDLIREKWEDDKKTVLGKALTENEVDLLVEKYRHSDCNRQINIGKDGVTHNMLADIHNHWRRAEAVRIKCLGLPTLDMDNVCFHLEDKSGGKVIYRHLNILLLYRGRHYDPKNRPVVPLMLWKPRAPIYPKLVQNVAEGLTFEETKEFRNRGLQSPSLMKLTRNGVYLNVVQKVRDAFQMEEVVRLDCSHVGTSDCKRIGVKLRDLVPCIPILFKDEQIILWRGKRHLVDQASITTKLTRKTDFSSKENAHVIADCSKHPGFGGDDHVTAVHNSTFCDVDLVAHIKNLVCDAHSECGHHCTTQQELSKLSAHDHLLSQLKTFKRLRGLCMVEAGILNS